MKSGNKGKERLRSEDRKAQIIDIALTLFAQKGFAKTKTREIAETAGISETLIFQHFKTKDGLIKAALATLFHTHPVSGKLKEHLEGVNDDYGFFRTIALHFIQSNQEDDRIMKLAIHSTLEGSHFGELTRTTNETGPSMLALISGYIQNRIEEGGFIKTNSEIAARLFVEAIFMYIADQTMAITGPILPFPDEEVVETLVGIFLAGLQKKVETV